MRVNVRSQYGRQHGVSTQLKSGFAGLEVGLKHAPKGSTARDDPTWQGFRAVTQNPTGAIKSFAQDHHLDAVNFKNSRADNGAIGR
jgi:hypothetical protein